MPKLESPPWGGGFKPHIIINDKGQILSFTIAPANVDDRQPLGNENFIKAIYGKLFAYKGYISKKLSDIPFVDGTHLMTQIRDNMKKSLMALSDRITLRKRSAIETNQRTGHSRDRSIGNFFTNQIAGLIACSFFEKKPSLKFANALGTSQLTLFLMNRTQVFR